MIHPRCCGIPGHTYGERARQPHASRPIPESRFVVVGGRVLAVAALVMGLVTAGSVALR